MKTSLVHVVWEITLACDLGCRHCGSRAGKARSDELSTAEALDVVRQLADMGAREVSLIGGEAYLRDDWHLIARAVHDAGMRASMVTGGRGLDAERARLAAEAKVDSVSVSIDGIGETHDVQRGLRGSFDAAVAALRNLREAGVPVSANSQLNRLSFPDLDRMLDLFVEHRAHSWQFVLTVPMGRAAERPDWLFQPWELLLLFPRLAALADRGREGGVHLYPSNNVGYFGPYETALGAAPDNGGGHWAGCRAGDTTLGIESDGTIKGCPSLPTSAYGAGNVRETSILELWSRSRELGFTRESRVDELWGYCKECYYAPVCQGGCAWTAHVFFGRRGNNPYCHHRALEMAERGLRERLVRTHPAPGEPFDHGQFALIEEPSNSPSPAWPTVAPSPDPRRLPLIE